jgi:hypothetical protein
MADAVDLIQLVKELPKRRRGRACFVLTHGYVDQEDWAAKLAKRTDSTHINLLEVFAANTELSAQVETYSPARLFQRFQQHDQTDVLVVSGMEFLKAVWSGQTDSMDEFARRVETWSRKPALLFVLQHDRDLAAYDFTRHSQYLFVVDQKETLKL